MSRKSMVFVSCCIVGLAAVVAALYYRDIRVAYRNVATGSSSLDQRLVATNPNSIR